MTRGEKLLRSQQHKRAVALHHYLETWCRGPAYANGILRANVITDWLAKEYRLGKAAAKREKTRAA